jgi:putative SOS response-associated peptidase YedK
MTDVPVVLVENDRQSRKLQDMEWGLLPFFAKDPATTHRPINAKSETVLENRFFSNAFKRQRCIIPIHGFFEWKKIKGRKQPYLITSKHNQPLGLAGIYDTWRRNEEESIFSFTILTTTPNELIQPIHDRMPVILPKELEYDWLSRDTEISNLITMFEPISKDSLQTYPVSSYVNKPTNNSELCIKPLTLNEDGTFPIERDEDQAMLDDFF